ncbi:hypothetical protein OB905_09195 [Halobacteria archaeon AArc-dxtr1]|nr:hypothetical protein [Halobacteria archaeon AArc-dxtr1]
MNRRTVLAFVGSSVASVGGYSTWSWYRQSVQGATTPAGMAVETMYKEDDVRSDQDDVIDTHTVYETIIETKTAAETTLEQTEAVSAFIADTDFAESYLVFVQNRMQPKPDLVLDSIVREDGRLQIALGVEVSGDVPGDSAIHSFLIRITDEEDDVPAEVTVTVDDL